MSYEIETRSFDGWEALWTDQDENGDIHPVRFATRSDAEAELRQYLASFEHPPARAEDFRIARLGKR